MAHPDGLDIFVRAHLSTVEDSSTADLIRRLRPTRSRGYLTPSEFQAAARWKSARAIHLIRANSPARVRQATQRALGTRSERLRLEALLSLRGVSVPMASAILTLLYPRRYGVLDIRVWQLLHRAGAVTGAPRGAGFTYDHWRQFLAVIRPLAKQHAVTARNVELALFEAHRQQQAGRLYDWPPVVEDSP